MSRELHRIHSLESSAARRDDAVIGGFDHFSRGAHADSKSHFYALETKLSAVRTNPLLRERQQRALDRVLVVGPGLTRRHPGGCEGADGHAYGPIVQINDAAAGIQRQPKLILSVEDPVRAIDGIRTELFRMTELRRMQPGTEVALSQPTEITDRMALIDTLGGLHRGTQDPVLQRNVRSVLEEMISRSFEPGLELHQKRLVLAEKFDCMALLARLDPQQAHGLLGSLQPGPMKSTLERAWALGLSDAGINPATYKDRLARF